MTLFNNSNQGGDLAKGCAIVQCNPNLVPAHLLKPDKSRHPIQRFQDILPNPGSGFRFGFLSLSLKIIVFCNSMG